MSQLHAELSQQAYELGFESLDQAIESGEYEVISNGSWAKLVLTKDEQEKAHEEWLKKRKEVIENLNDLYNELAYIKIDDEYLDTVGDTIEFIKQGEI